MRISPMIGMSMGISAYDLGTNSGGTVDRRETSRFPVREEVRYRVLHAKGLAASGVGKTLDIGSGGILFTTQERLPMGRLVEVAANWPVRLGAAGVPGREVVVLHADEVGAILQRVPAVNGVNADRRTQLVDV